MYNYHMESANLAKLNDFKNYYEESVVNSINSDLLDTYLTHLEGIQTSRNNLITFIDGSMNIKISDVKKKYIITNFPNITDYNRGYIKIHNDSPCHYNFSFL